MRATPVRDSFRRSWRIFGDGRGRSRPALVRNRHNQSHVETLGAETLLHLSVELPLDRQVDELGAETGAPAAPGRGPVPLLPVEREGRTVGGAGGDPGHVDTAAPA